MDEEKAQALAQVEAAADQVKAAIDSAITDAQVATEKEAGIAAIATVKAQAKSAIDAALTAIDAATTNAKVEEVKTAGLAAIEAINPPPSILKQKTIAFNLSNHLALVHYENGKFNPVTSLAQAPASAENYFVLANNASGKELLLPIEKFEDKDGKVQASVTTSQIHRYDTQTKKYESGLTLVFDRAQLKASEHTRIDVALSDVPGYDAQKAVAYANAQKNAAVLQQPCLGGTRKSSDRQLGHQRNPLHHPFGR